MKRNFDVKFIKLSQLFFFCDKKRDGQTRGTQYI